MLGDVTGVEDKVKAKGESRAEIRAEPVSSVTSPPPPGPRLRGSQIPQPPVSPGGCISSGSPRATCFPLRLCQPHIQTSCFLGLPWLGLCASSAGMQWTRVPSLVGELRSCMPAVRPKKKKKKKLPSFPQGPERLALLSERLRNSQGPPRLLRSSPAPKPAVAVTGSARPYPGAPRASPPPPPTCPPHHPPS